MEITIPGPPTIVFHHINGFEDAGRPGTLVLDSIHYDSLPVLGREPTKAQKVDPDAGFKPL